MFTSVDLPHPLGPTRQTTLIGDLQADRVERLRVAPRRLPAPNVLETSRTTILPMGPRSFPCQMQGSPLDERDDEFQAYPDQATMMIPKKTSVIRKNCQRPG